MQLVRYIIICALDWFSLSHTPSFNRFREGKERVLIMTNCCASGMHIDISLVVNYDIPVDAHNNTHADCAAYLRR